MGTSLQLVDRLVPGANLESYIQAASRIPFSQWTRSESWQNGFTTMAMWKPPVIWCSPTCAL